MGRTFIGDLGNKVGQEVSISGWVDIRRDHGKLIFIDVRDMSSKVQVVLVPQHEEAKAVGERLRPEWVVRITGTVRERPEPMRVEGVNGRVELEAASVQVLSEAQELPFEKAAELNLDTYLDHLPLTLRTERVRDIFKIQATIIESFREALRKEHFTEFQAPALVGGDAEGGAAAFKVNYYNDKDAFLATSPQFYKQIMVGSSERAFATARVFRGEKHSTTRHLSEYCSLDFEMGFTKDHTDVMVMLEKVVRHIVQKTEEQHGDAMARMKAKLPLLPEEIPTLKLREAQKLLGAGEEPDLEPEQERDICAWAKKECGSDFIFITHYPVSKRPFYTYEDEADPGFTKSFDLLFRGLEITTGGQRIYDYDTLVERIKGRGLDPEKFSFYLQAFKFGLPPHGGSATGLERFTARLLNLPNIKEATLFPRDMNRIDTLLSKNE